MRIDLEGEVTASGIFTIEVGDPGAISIYVDAGTADENPTAGLFLATDPGNATFQFADFTPGEAAVLTVDADAGAGDWDADLEDSIGDPYPITLSLTGLGLTADQILPDYTGFTSGTALFEVASGPFIFDVEADIDAVSIAFVDPPPPPLPAANAAQRALLGAALGVATAGLLGRRWRSRGRV